MTAIVMHLVVVVLSTVVTYLPAIVLFGVVAFFAFATALQEYYDRKYPYSDWNL